MTREEALKVANEMCHWLKTDREKEALETLVPELKESDDERIRKWLTDLFSNRNEKFVQELDNYRGLVTREQILAYLEKQKGQKPSINIEQLKSMMLQYLQEAANEKDDLDIEADTDKWARKILGYDFELKPVERNEEDERIRKRLMNIVGLYYGTSTVDPERDECIAYLEKQKEQKPEEKPINWTELTWKDIVELEGIINNVHYDFSAGIGQESFGKEVLERFRNKKDDAEVDACEQKSAEYGKDERIRKKLIEYFNHYKEDREWWEGITPRDIISYLEMQKPSFRQIHDGIMWDSGLRAGIKLGKKEQKPEERFEEAREKYQVEWSEEDIDASVKSYSDSLPMCGEFQSYHDALVHAYRQGIVNALKSLRPKDKAVINTPERGETPGKKFMVKCKTEKSENLWFDKGDERPAYTIDNGFGGLTYLVYLREDGRGNRIAYPDKEGFLDDFEIIEKPE